MESPPAGVKVDEKTYNKIQKNTALVKPAYRWFLSGSAISYTGDWMDQLTLNWLVLEMTNSPFYMGLVNFFRLTPVLLLSLFGGVIADRVERRKLMLVTNTLAMFTAFVLAFLVFARRAAFWQVLVIVFARGTLVSLERPARQALIPELLEGEELLSGLALNSAVRNGAKIIGPTIGGLLIGITGMSMAFFLNALSFIAVIVSLVVIRGHKKVIPIGPRVSFKQELLEGFHFVLNKPVVASLLILTLAPMLFHQPYRMLMPVFARDILHVGAKGLGFLMSAPAVGAFCGAVFLSGRSNLKNRGKVMVFFATLYGCFLMFFSLSRSYPLSLLALFLVGLTQQVYSTLTTTSLQLAIPGNLTGRVMSFYQLDRGLVPLGTLLMGWLATAFGAPSALFSMSVLGLALIFYLIIKIPGVRAA